MLFGQILMFFFLLFGHPRLSGSLQTVRHDIYNPKPLQKASLLCFRKRILRVGQWGDFTRKRKFKVGWEPTPPTPRSLRVYKQDRKKCVPYQDKSNMNKMLFLVLLCKYPYPILRGERQIHIVQIPPPLHPRCKEANHDRADPNHCLDTRGTSYKPCQPAPSAA